jgi:hypothetical protein
MNQKDREEIVLLKADVEYIKKDVAETKETVKEFNDKMSKITNKLFNDDDTGELGYISIVKTHGIRLTKLENIKIALLSLLFALGSVFGWIAKNILER